MATNKEVHPRQPGVTNGPRFHRALFATAGLLLFAGGCAVGPDYSRPDVALPESFLAGPAGEGVVGPSWFDGFDDAILAGLLGIARTNNLGVLKTAVRIGASRAALAGSKAEYWPRVGFSAGATKGKTFDPDATTERASVGFDASWEPDFFGKVRRSVEAAEAELAAAELSLSDALLSLDAEVAAEYVNLRLLQTHYSVAATNLVLQREFYAISKAKFDAGMASERDSLSSKAQVHSTEAALPEAAAAITACIRRIEILLALNPGALDSLLAPPAPIPAAPDVALTVPSDLLRRRPDVRRAEKAYAASLARIGVAKANYFPSVSIGASAGLSNDSFSNWGDAVKSLGFGPSVNWTILSFGRTRAKVRQAEAAAEEATLDYRETVLRAVHEVEADAVDLDKALASVGPLRDALSAQEKVLGLSRKMYEQDLGEYLDVVSAQQAKLSAERSAAQAEAQVALSKIALHKALGGAPTGN